MRRLCIALVFAGLAAPAFGQTYLDLRNCEMVKTYSATEGKNPEKLAGCIKEMEEREKKLGDILVATWKLLADPTSILEQAAESLRSTPSAADLTLGWAVYHAHFQVSKALGYVLNNSSLGWPKDAAGRGETPFGFIRMHIADPDRLKALYYGGGKDRSLQIIRRIAVVGFATSVAENTRVVFEKPFATKMGELWVEWRNTQCDEEKGADDPCKKVTFEAEFEKTYGAKPSDDQALVIGFLHRRHAEGGVALVKMWQEIGNDFANALSPKPVVIAPVAAAKQQKK